MFVLATWSSPTLSRVTTVYLSGMLPSYQDSSVIVVSPATITYRMSPRPGSPLTSTFLCSLLNSPQMHDVVSRYANGTTVNMLPLDALQKPLIVLPPKALIVVFDMFALHTVRRREAIVCETRTLCSIRDSLLPKLVSGELRVSPTARSQTEGKERRC